MLLKSREFSMSSSWWNYFSKKTNKKSASPFFFFFFFFVRSFLINGFTEIKMDFRTVRTQWRWRLSTHLLTNPVLVLATVFCHTRLLPQQAVAFSPSRSLSLQVWICCHTPALPRHKHKHSLMKPSATLWLTSLLQPVANWSTNTTSYSQLPGERGRTATRPAWSSLFVALSHMSVLGQLAFKCEVIHGVLWVYTLRKVFVLSKMLSSAPVADWAEVQTSQRHTEENNSKVLQQFFFFPPTINKNITINL